MKTAEAEARDAGKHPTMPRADSPSNTKNYSFTSVSRNLKDASKEPREKQIRNGVKASNMELCHFIIADGERSIVLPGHL